jgi:multisubunit Na+/H+ antiporter MnhG subunit
VLGIPLIAAAIVVSDGFTTSGTTACLVALTVLLLSPFSTHFLGRAIRVREFGRWVVLPAERANQQSEGHD